MCPILGVEGLGFRVERSRVGRISYLNVPHASGRDDAPLRLRRWSPSGRCPPRLRGRHVSVCGFLLDKSMVYILGINSDASMVYILDVNSDASIGGLLVADTSRCIY